VGAGLVGAAVANELARAGYQTAVFEAASQPAAGASCANSGILHTGFDSPPGTLETDLIRDQALCWQAVFDNLQVPYRKTGAIMLAQSSDDAQRLPHIAETAAGNGVTVQLLNRAQLQSLEPGANANAALLIPDEAITDPYEVVRRLLSFVPVRYHARVTRIDPASNGAALIYLDDAVKNARVAINCAGLFADELAADSLLKIIPRRGEFVAYAPSNRLTLEHILLPIPTPRTKGILVFPTLYGHVCAGPSATDQADKNDWRPRGAALAHIRARASALYPILSDLQPVAAWAGLRPSGHPRNYFIEWSARVPSMLSVAAIRSTGLSACLGIARYVHAALQEKGILPHGRQFAINRSEFDARKPWWERSNELHGVSGPC